MSVTQRLNSIFKTTMTAVCPGSRLPTFLYEGSYLAGGVVRDALLGEPHKDVDVFFRNTVSGVLAARYVITNLTPGWNLEVLPDAHHPNISQGLIRVSGQHAPARRKTTRAITENAITHVDGMPRKVSQFILRFMAQPEDLVSTFDFEHNKITWEPGGYETPNGVLKFHGESQASLAGRKIIFNPGSRFLLSTLQRLPKMLGRGFELPMSTVVGLASALGSLDLANPTVLNEELKGLYGLNDETRSLLMSACVHGGQVNIEKIIKILGDV